MSYIAAPEYHLEPPEDTRKRVYTCEYCGEDILEDDEYYDIPGVGPCCAKCIEDSRHYAELEDPNEYEHM